MLFGVFLTPWPYSETFPSIQSKELNKKIRKQGCREKLAELSTPVEGIRVGKQHLAALTRICCCLANTHRHTQKTAQEKAEHPPPSCHGSRNKVTALGDSWVTLSNTARKGSQALGLKGKGRHSFRKKMLFSLIQK